MPSSYWAQVRWYRISNNEDISNFVCTPLYSRITLTDAIETMHFFHSTKEFTFEDIFCISWVPMNDLAPMKNCPGVGRDAMYVKLGSRGNYIQISDKFTLNVFF